MLVSITLLSRFFLNPPSSVPSLPPSRPPLPGSAAGNGKKAGATPCSSAWKRSEDANMSPSPVVSEGAVHWRNTCLTSTSPSARHASL